MNTPASPGGIDRGVQIRLEAARGRKRRPDCVRNCNLKKGDFQTSVIYCDERPQHRPRRVPTFVGSINKVDA